MRRSGVFLGFDVIVVDVGCVGRWLVRRGRQEEDESLQGIFGLGYGSDLFVWFFGIVYWMVMGLGCEKMVWDGGSDGWMLRYCDVEVVDWWDLKKLGY